MFSSEALGQVLQIFLHDSVVDAFAYGSQPLGALAPRGLPVSAWLRQQCPIEGQVRLVPHPDLFLAGATPRGWTKCEGVLVQAVAIHSATSKGCLNLKDLKSSFGKQARTTF